MRNPYIKNVESFAYIASTQVSKLPVSHDLSLITIYNLTWQESIQLMFSKLQSTVTILRQVEEYSELCEAYSELSES